MKKTTNYNGFVCFVRYLDGTTKITDINECKYIYVKNVKKFKKFCEKHHICSSYVNGVGYYEWIPDSTGGAWDFISVKRKDLIKWNF